MRNTLYIITLYAHIGNTLANNIYLYPIIFSIIYYFWKCQLQPVRFISYAVKGQENSFKILIRRLPPFRVNHEPNNQAPSLGFVIPRKELKVVMSRRRTASADGGTGLQSDATGLGEWRKTSSRSEVLQWLRKEGLVQCILLYLVSSNRSREPWIEGV